MNTPGTTLREIALLRLVAQRIAGSDLATAADTVRWLGAAQAQDYRGALTSVALRTASGSRASVEAALDAGEIVKSWPMRGTLHLVAAEDLPWMLSTLAPRVLQGAARRYAQLGLDGPAFERAARLAVEALATDGRLRRAELMTRWDDAGLSTAGQRGAHLLGYLAQTGLVCFGPTQGGEQLVVLVDDWVPHSRVLDRAEALGELALRYFRSHGPATVKDFARWTKLGVTDARQGVETVRPRLDCLSLDGVDYLLDPNTPARLEGCRREALGVFLLPGFDEFMLGYGDRSAALPREFADRIAPGGNGMFRPTVIRGGEVVGTWKHAGRGANRSIDATPFRSFSAEVVKAIEIAYSELP